MIVCTFLFYYWQCLFDYYSCFCLKFHRFVLLSYEVESGIWASFFLVAVVVGIFLFCFWWIYLFIFNFLFFFTKKVSMFCLYVEEPRSVRIIFQNPPLWDLSTVHDSTPFSFYLFLFIYFFCSILPTLYLFFLGIEFFHLFVKF